MALSNLVPVKKEHSNETEQNATKGGNPPTSDQFIPPISWNQRIESSTKTRGHNTIDHHLTPHTTNTANSCYDMTWISELNRIVMPGDAKMSPQWHHTHVLPCAILCLLQWKRWCGRLASQCRQRKQGSQRGAETRRTCHSARSLSAQCFQRPGLQDFRTSNFERTVQSFYLHGSAFLHRSQTCQPLHSVKAAKKPRYKNKWEVNETGEHLCEESP